VSDYLKDNPNKFPKSEHLFLFISTQTTLKHALFSSHFLKKPDNVIPQSQTKRNQTVITSQSNNLQTKQNPKSKTLLYLHFHIKPLKQQNAFLKNESLQPLKTKQHY